MWPDTDAGYVWGVEEVGANPITPTYEQVDFHLLFFVQSLSPTINRLNEIIYEMDAY